MNILPKILYISILIIGSFALTITVFAGHPCINLSNSITPGSHLCQPNAAPSIDIIFQSIANFLLLYGMPFVVIFMIIAGFMFVTARGNEEQLTKAKTMLWWTIVGTAIIIGANLIVKAIEKFGEQLV